MNSGIPPAPFGRSVPSAMIAIVSICVAALVTISPAIAQNYDAQLVEPEESSTSFFGAAVAIDGDWAFVGAPFNSESGEEAGAVYVYRFNGVVWSRTQKLLPVTGQGSSGWFGFSLAVSDGYAVVGSPQTERPGGRSGAVCIFRLHDNVWIRESHLTAPVVSPGMAFGASVAIDGNHVLIGASSDSWNGPRSGAAYIFSREVSGWGFEAMLTPDSSEALDAFGRAVALDGDRALIGAPWTRQAGMDAGSAFVFEKSGSEWIQVAKLVGLESASGDMLGESVSLSGDIAAVGASRAEECESGAVYVFRRSGDSWIQESRLTAPVSAEEHLFGASVSVGTDILLVGAPFFRDSQAPGSVYRFDRDDEGWTLTAAIQSATTDAANHFGQSVCLSDTRMIAGAFGEPTWSGIEGSAFIYSVPDAGPMGYTLIYPW